LGVQQFETELHAHAYSAADFNKSTPKAGVLNEKTAQHIQGFACFL